MPGRNLVTAKRDGHFIKRSEFQTRVAGDARYRRLAVEIALNKRLDDRLFKLAFQIQNIKREAQPLGNTPGVINIVERAAAGRQWVAVFIDTYPPALIPELHSKPDQLVPLLL